MPDLVYRYSFCESERSLHLKAGKSIINKDGTIYLQNIIRYGASL
jgi:hypothetical protein